jgi:hypothetical protein
LFRAIGKAGKDAYFQFWRDKKPLGGNSMTEIMLNIPVRPASGQIEDLRAGLRPFAEVQEPPAKSFDFTGLALIVGFSANALQIIDILKEWLKRTPHGNYAEIRLSDGRTFKMEANTDPDEFVKQLKAALKEM